MKKLLVLSLVLGVASLANAALLISVDGVVDPPDTEITLVESDWVTLDIYSDGTTPGAGVEIRIDGPGSYDIANAINYINAGFIFPISDTVIFADIALPQVPVPPVPEGTAVDGILFHCDGPGDVIILLVDGVTGETYDEQVIHQIVPEPATMALLGLGGLFLRRKK